MTIIKNLAFLNKKRLKNLSSFVESELDFSAFYPFPIDLLHNFLPYKLKFLNETYVALDNNKVKGLITLLKTGSSKVKITRLLLDENSFESGKLLVNCVTGFFLSKGAESFFVVADKNDTPLLTMFVQGCGFKQGAVETVYKIKKNDILMDTLDINFEHIRKMIPGDIQNVLEFINGQIYADKKFSFEKNSSILRRRFIFGPAQYIIFEKTNQKTLGYFTLLKLNKNEWALDFAINTSYEGYIIDIIKYAKIVLLKDSNFKTLYVNLKNYYINHQELAGILSFEFKHTHENIILVKDFMVQKRRENFYEKMIFNDVTPAF